MKTYQILDQEIIIVESWSLREDVLGYICWGNDPGYQDADLDL